MPYFKIALSSIVLSVILVFSTQAQDYTHLWNAFKRVEIGLDQPAKEIGKSGSKTTVTDVRVFPSTNPQDENSLAVSLVNPQSLFMSTNGRIIYHYDELGQIVIDTVYQPWFFSTNGGTQWSGSENLPSSISNSYGDPVALFDASGRAYYMTLGKPSGIYVSSTTNTGTTWSAMTNADQLNSNGDDKEHAATDISGTYPNNVYVAWTDFNVSGAPVVIARSTNNGSTWSSRTSLAIGTNRGQGAHIATGPNGEVYIAWAHYTTGTAEAGKLDSRSLRMAEQAIQQHLSFSPSTESALQTEGLRL